MSSIEIIEEYRALWAQAQQELQMTQILVAVVLKESGLDNLQVPTRTLQEVAEGYTLDLDANEEYITINLEENKDA